MIVVPYNGKRSGIGRNRSHAQNRTPRKFGKNLQKATFYLDGEKVTGTFASKDLKRLKKEAGDSMSHKKTGK